MRRKLWLHGGSIYFKASPLPPALPSLLYHGQISKQNSLWFHLVDVFPASTMNKYVVLDNIIGDKGIEQKMSSLLKLPTSLRDSENIQRFLSACSVSGPVLGAEVIVDTNQLQPLLSQSLYSNEGRKVKNQKNKQACVETKTDANRASLGQKEDQIIWMSDWASLISLQSSKLIPRVGSLFTSSYKNKSLYYKTTKNTMWEPSQKSNWKKPLQDQREDVTANKPQLCL